MEYRYTIGTKNKIASNYFFFPGKKQNSFQKHYITGTIEANTEKEAGEIFKRILSFTY